MSEVTSDDVRYTLIDAMYDDNGNNRTASDILDALIAAFPHLVGEVEITSAEGGYSAPDGPSGDRPEHWTPRVRTVHTVTGPWREAER